METTTIKIQGMTCSGCVQSVTRVLEALDGVNKVNVSLEDAQATVEYTPGRVNPARLHSAIEGAGFEVVR
jgi:copper chaperone